MDMQELWLNEILILALLLVAPSVPAAAATGEVPPARERARVDRPDAGTIAVAGLTADEQATIRDLIRQADYQFAWQVSDEGRGLIAPPTGQMTSRCPWLPMVSTPPATAKGSRCGSLASRWRPTANNLSLGHRRG